MNDTNNSNNSNNSKKDPNDSPAGRPDFWEHFNEQPFHAYLGVTLEERRKDYGRIQLRRTDSTPTGIGGSVHGGVLATMIDLVTIVAVFAELRPGEQPAGTADLNISYLRQTQGEVVTCTGEVIKRGRQLAVVDAKITDSAQRLCAVGRVLYAFRAAASGI